MIVQLVMNLCQAVMNLCQLVGPALNLVMVYLPRFTLPAAAGGLRFDNLTWCGYFVTMLALAYVLVVMAVFEDPPAAKARAKASTEAQSASKADGGPVALNPREMLRHVGRSRGWVCAHCAYVNNFTGNCLNYYIPIYAAEAYGFGQVCPRHFHAPSFVFCSESPAK
jgi:hypothetical protein